MNQVDYGPVATTIITTLKQPTASTNEEKFALVIASEHTIMLKGQNFFFDKPEFVYNTTDLITGMAIHVAKKLLFVSDDTGKIYKASLDKNDISERQAIFSSERLNAIPINLSMDWLKENLYILFEVQSQV